MDSISYESVTRTVQSVSGLLTRFCCPTCSSSFSRLDTLNYHLKKQHGIPSVKKPCKSKQHEWHCMHCELVFKSKQDFCRHKAYFTGKYKCQICGRHFDRLKYLRSHLESGKHRSRMEVDDSDSSDGDILPFSVSYPTRYTDLPSPGICQSPSHSPVTPISSSPDSEITSQSELTDLPLSSMFTFPDISEEAACSSSDVQDIPLNSPEKTRKLRCSTRNKDVDATIAHGILNPYVHPKHLVIEHYSGKGYGVKTLCPIPRSTFICSYHGKHISLAEALLREKELEDTDPDGGDYIFFNGNQCIDATIDDGTLGRLLNHSRKAPNCVAKPYMLNGKSFIILKSISDIEALSELVFDYRESRPEIIALKPWLADS